MRVSARTAGLCCCYYAALLGSSSSSSSYLPGPVAVQAKMLRWSADHGEAGWAPARQTPLGYMPSLGMKGLLVPAIDSPPRPTDPPRVLPRVGGGRGGLLERDTANNTCAYIDGNPKDPLFCATDDFCAVNSANSHVGCCPGSTTSCPVWTTCLNSADSSLFTTNNGLTLFCGSSSFPYCRSHIYQDSFITGFTLLGCAVTAGIDEVLFSTTPTTTSVPSASSATTTPTGTSTGAPPPAPSSPSSPSSVNIGAIVGGVVGGVVSLLLLALLLFCLCRRRRRNKSKTNKSKTNKNSETTTTTQHYNTTNNNNAREFFYQAPPPRPPTRGRNDSGSSVRPLTGSSVRPPTGSSLASGVSQMTAYHEPYHYPQYPAPAVVIRTDGGVRGSPPPPPPPPPPLSQRQSLGTAIVSKPSPALQVTPRTSSYEGADVHSNNGLYGTYDQSSQRASSLYSSQASQYDYPAWQQREAVPPPSTGSNPPSPPSSAGGWGGGGGGGGGGAGLYRQDSRSRVVSELSTLRESGEEISELE